MEDDCMYTISISYSNGEYEVCDYGEYGTKDEAYKEMCALACHEAYVQNEEFLCENTCYVCFDAYSHSIDLHYDVDDVWCYYKVVKK